MYSGVQCTVHVQWNYQESARHMMKQNYLPIVSGINRRLYLSGTTPAASIIRGSRVTALTEAEMLFDRPRDMEFWRVLNIDEFLSVLDSSDFDLSID